MKKYKHLNYEERLIIERLISLNYSCKQMSEVLLRNESTIRQEIKNNRYKNEVNPFNNFTPGTCICSFKFPYVCNNCKKRNGKKDHKYFYTADRAQKKYNLHLSFSRTGTNIDEDTIKLIDETIITGLSHNQPINHIVHGNNLPISVSTVYRWIHDGVLSASIFDLQNAIKYKPRKSLPKRNANRANRKGRTYKDYQEYITNNPWVNIIEMDTVEGLKSDKKCLITFVCLKSALFFSSLLEAQTSHSVIESLNEIEKSLGYNEFKNYLV